MSSATIGARPLARILRHPPAGVRTLPSSKPATPFQKLWLQRADLAQQSIKANQAHEELTDQAERLELETQRLATAVGAQQEAVEQADAAVAANAETNASTQAQFEKISQNIETARAALEAASSAIKGLTAALALFEPGGAAENLPGANEQAKITAARTERDLVQEKTNTLSAHIEASVKAAAKLEESLELLASTRNGLVATSDRASETLQRTRQQKGVVDQKFATCRSAIAEQEKAREQIQAEISKIDQGLESLSPAVKLIMQGAGAIEATAEPATLTRALELINRELLPMLKEGTALHSQVSALQVALKKAGSQPVAMTLAEEERLLQESPAVKIAMEALSGNGGARLAAAEVAPVLAFLAKRIPVWESLAASHPEAPEVAPRLAMLTTIRMRLEIAQATAEEKTILHTNPLADQPANQPLTTLESDQIQLERLITLWGRLETRYPENEKIRDIATKRRETKSALDSLITRRNKTIHAVREATDAIELEAWPSRGSQEHIKTAILYGRARKDEATVGLLTTHYSLKELEAALPYLEASVRIWTDARGKVNKEAGADDPFKAKVERKQRALGLVSAAMNHLREQSPPPLPAQGDFQAFAGGAEGELTSPDGSFFGRTNKGTRDHQEDSALHYKCPEREVLAVFDGMGGHVAGEVASRIATEIFQDPANGLAAGKSPAELIRIAHTAIMAEAAMDPGKKGMGTTAAIAEIRGNKVSCANTGDSDVYLLKADGNLIMISQDHSAIAYVQSPGMAGPKPPLAGKALKNFYEDLRTAEAGLVSGVAKILGHKNMSGTYEGDQAANPYVSQEYYYGPGDMVLVLTDGPRSYVPFDAFAAVLDPGKTPKQQARDIERVTRTFMQGRGGDNITVLVHKNLTANPAPAGAQNATTVFSSLEKPELQWLVRPTTENGFTTVTDPESLHKYIGAYLRAPLDCVQAENQALARYYQRLQAQTKRTGFLGHARALLTPEQAETRFNQALRTAIAARAKIEAALFPNGKGRQLDVADINDPTRYEEIIDATYLYHNAAIPAVINAELGVPMRRGEIGVVNKGPVDSRGYPAKIFAFMLAAKKMAVQKIATGKTRPIENVKLARDLFVLLNRSYSPNQEPAEEELEGAARTQSFFMRRGGCCRHRSIALQLGYQEAAIPSATYSGYIDKSAHFSGMLAGPHMWLLLDPLKNNAWNYLADPNRSYDSKNPQARFFGRITETEDQAWTAPPNFFDGQTKIFSLKSRSGAYRKLTGQIRGIEVDYYVAQEKFNSLWRPLLGVEIA